MGYCHEGSPLFALLFSRLAGGSLVKSRVRKRPEISRSCIWRVLGSPGSILASRAIEQVIGSRPKFQYFDEYLDENRLGTDYSVVAANLQRKYVNQKMDLIITAWPEASAVPFSVR